MHVGERIQQKMIERHISQNKLAKAANISQSGLSSIISGASSPKEVTLSAIANALDCSVSELMGEGGDDPATSAVFPKTIEARILSEGVDRMPKEQREQALQVFRAVFTKYADYFDERKG